MYIREAHAKDGRRPIPVGEGIEILTARSLEHRQQNATACVKDLQLSIPALLDDMENTTDHAYGGWPDRLVVIDAEGKIAYRGARGPFGFDPGAAEQVLRGLLKEDG